MEKLTDERVVQPWLPLLNEGKLQALEIGAASKKSDWGPDEQVFLFPPVAQGQFCLNEAVMSTW